MSAEGLKPPERIQRWTMEGRQGADGPVEDNEGWWVEYRDHAAKLSKLTEELEEVKKENRELREEIKDLQRGGMSTLDEEGVQQTL